MIPDPAEAWPPQKPPVNFAHRVVDALVRERAAMGAASGSSVGTRARVRRGSVLLAAAASLLLVGSAWAAWQARPARKIAPAPAASLASAAKLAPLPGPPAQPAATPTVVAGAAPALAAPVTAPARRKVVAAVLPSPPASAVAAPRLVIVPPCICHDIACDCGPDRP